MRLHAPITRLVAIATAISSALSAATTTTALTFTLPANPPPANLPLSTHATLSALGTVHRAPLTAANTFVFGNVTAGSYLADVHCPSHAFVPLRVDVIEEDGRITLAAWETYRGNDWDNKGEALQLREGGKDRGFEMRPLGVKNYFVERVKFSALNILKNPTILLAGVSMLLFIGMPYMVDSMDPEMRAEFEERQKNSPMNSILGAQQGGANPLGDFDMAGYLAGSKKNGDKKKK